MKKFFSAIATLLFCGAMMTACSEPEAESAVITITPAELTFDWQAMESQEVTILSTHDWRLEVEEGKEWIHLSLNSYFAGKEATVKVLITTDNPSTEPRRGRIAVHSEGTTEYLTVIQKGKVEEMPVLPRENCYTINGTEQLFPSIAFMMLGENPAIVASPRMGLGSGEEILNSGDYFYAAVNPTLNGMEFDIMTESSPFTIMSTLKGALLECVAPEMTEEVRAGKATFTIEDNKAYFIANLTLLDGTEFAVNIAVEAKGEIVINENIISRGDERKPLRTAFYMNEEGMTYLYFTPAGIDYAEELEIATWYMYLMVDDRFVSGQTTEISSSTLSGSNFCFGVMDNLNENNSWAITSDDLGGAEGSFLLKRNGEGNYTTLLNITYGSVEYTVTFEGDCISCYDAPVVETNYILYNGEKKNLSAATIDATDSSVWSISFAVNGGTTATATIPSNFLDGNARGFSQSPNLTVSYGGETFSKANGHSGTVTALLDEEALTLEFSFTNYKNCEISYSGAVTIHQ